MSKEYSVILEDDLFEKFKIALALAREEEQEAIERCIKHYIATSFGKIRDAYADDWFPKQPKTREQTANKAPVVKRRKPKGAGPEREYYLHGNPCSIKEFQAAIVDGAFRIRYTVFYQDGSHKEKVWNAKKITASSNLSGNINTGILRNWKEDGIVRVRLEID
jgi:hypothetical protein